MTSLEEIKGTGAPLRRALAAEGITTLEQIAGKDFTELLALHGVGLKGLNRVNDALIERGLTPMTNVSAAKPATTTKAELKTVPTDVDPREWIESLPWPRRVQQGLELLEIFHQVTGVQPVMWGESMVGYGDFHYRYDTGREGDVFRVGFSPRKTSISLYGLQGFDAAPALLDQLGPHKRGVGCIYVTRLAEVDQQVLKQLIRGGWESDSTC